MANLIKTVNYFDDGTTIEYDAAPVVAPSQIVSLTPGQSIEVVAQN